VDAGEVGGEARRFEWHPPFNALMSARTLVL
jgi:hypothetical protein